MQITSSFKDFDEVLDGFKASAGRLFLIVSIFFNLYLMWFFFFKTIFGINGICRPRVYLDLGLLFLLVNQRA